MDILYLYWLNEDKIRNHSPPRLRCQTESRYVQTVPDGKFLCQDYRAFKTFSAFFVRSKLNMSRPSQSRSVYVRTFVRSCPDHRALQIKFVRSKSKVLERPCPDHRAFMSRLSCVHQTEKKIASCGTVLFVEDEGGRGFSKFDYFHRVNLLFKLNQILPKIFWYSLSGKNFEKRKFAINSNKIFNVFISDQRVVQIESN